MHSAHGDHSGHSDIQASHAHTLTDYLTNFSPVGSIHGNCLPCLLRIVLLGTHAELLSSECWL
jgi:hypothetical protein